jgi:hypothetical protein
VSSRSPASRRLSGLLKAASGAEWVEIFYVPRFSMYCARWEGGPDGPAMYALAVKLAADVPEMDVHGISWLGENKVPNRKAG